MTSAVTAVEQTVYASVALMMSSSAVARFFSVVTCFCRPLICAASDFSVGPLLWLAPAGEAASSRATAATVAMARTCLM